jgi:hypothetical protein
MYAGQVGFARSGFAVVGRRLADATYPTHCWRERGAPNHIHGMNRPDEYGPVTPLRASVDSYLREVDRDFEQQSMPITYRSLQGALGYVEEMVRSVRGGTKEKPIGQVWFDAILYETHRWYVARYGDAMRVDSGGQAAGVVLLGGAPVVLSIPLSVKRPGSEPLTIRLSFPDSVLDDEDPLAFIEGQVGVQAFPSDAQARLRENIEAIVRQTRQLNRGFRFADLSKTAQALVDRVMWTLDQAIVSIAANSPSRLSMAVSELNLFSELSLKVFLSQHEKTVRPIHDVPELYRHAVAVGLPVLSEDVLEAFPKEKHVSKHKYGVSKPPSLERTVALYDASLTLGLHCASHCAHSSLLGANAWIELYTIGARARGE